MNPVAAICHVLAIVLGVVGGIWAVNSLSPDLPDEDVEPGVEIPVPVEAESPESLFNAGPLSTAIFQLEGQEGDGAEYAFLSITPTSLIVSDITGGRRRRAERYQHRRARAGDRAAVARAQRRSRRRRCARWTWWRRRTASSGWSISTRRASRRPRSTWCLTARMRSRPTRRCQTRCFHDAGFRGHDLRKRYDSSEALRGVSLEVPRGRGGRAPGPERCGQVDAGEDRLRAGAPDAAAAPRSRGIRRGAPRRGRGSAIWRSSSGSRRGSRPTSCCGSISAWRAPKAAPRSGPTSSSSSGCRTPRASGRGRCRRGCSSAWGSLRRWWEAPSLLLLDEPTSALDPAGRKVVRELSAEVRGRGVSVLLSSHLLSEVELVSDQVVILVDGEVVERGTSAELRTPARGAGGDGRVACGCSRGRARTTRRGSSRELVRGGRERLRRRGSLLDARGRVSRGGGGGGDVSRLSDARIIVGYALAESVRRRVVAVVAVLTAALSGALCAGRPLRVPGGGERVPDRRRARRREGARGRDDLRARDVRRAVPGERACDLPDERRGAGAMRRRACCSRSW